MLPKPRPKVRFSPTTQARSLPSRVEPPRATGAEADFEAAYGKRPNFVFMGKELTVEVP